MHEWIIFIMSWWPHASVSMSLLRNCYLMHLNRSCRHYVSTVTYIFVSWYIYIWRHTQILHFHCHPMKKYQTVVGVSKVTVPKGMHDVLKGVSIMLYYTDTDSTWANKIFSWTTPQMHDQSFDRLICSPACKYCVPAEVLEQKQTYVCVSAQVYFFICQSIDPTNCFFLISW